MSVDMSEETLPAGFHELEPFVAAWALPAEVDRCNKRLSLTLSELRVFYEAIQPRMDDVMQYLKNFPTGDLATLPVAALNLYHLALSYMEASHPIELKWKSVDLADAFPADRIQYQVPSSRS